jgi:hypothetical protein
MNVVRFGKIAMFVTRCWGLLLLTVSLGACADAYFPVAPPQEAAILAESDPRNVGKEPRKAAWQDIRLVQPVSFCFNEANASQEDLELEAKAFCKGGTVEHFATNTYFRRCPLFQPQRITFMCFPGVED